MTMVVVRRRDPYGIRSISENRSVMSSTQRRTAKRSQSRCSRRAARDVIAAGLEELDEQETDLAVDEAIAEHWEDIMYLEQQYRDREAARMYNDQLADAFVASLFAKSPPRPKGRGPLYAFVDRALAG